jgi:hypothetical protein
MCAVEAQRCVDCVSAVLHAVLTRAATLRGAFDANRRAWCSGTRCALWTIDLLVDDNDQTSADSPSDPTGGWCSCELGQNGARA